MGSKNNTSAISLAEIGEKLKSAREKKGVTIDQAQRQTHIHSTVLVALESGRSDEVLTPTYVKSFLKKYSSYLGMDSVQSVKEYMSLHPELDTPSAKFDFNMALPKKRAGIAGYFRILRNTFLIVVGVFLFVITVRGAIGFVKASHKTPAVKTIVRVKDLHAVTAKTTQKKISDKPQIPQIQIPDNEPITLVVKVKADVYVGVKRDGVVQFKRLVPKGTVETLIAKDKLNISIAKARSVELVLNGHPLEAFGKGIIKDLEITRKGIKVK